MTIPHNRSYDQVSSRLTLLPFSALVCLVLSKIQLKKPPDKRACKKEARLYNFSFFSWTHKQQGCGCPSPLLVLKHIQILEKEETK